jgi:hypothetical protein
MTMRTPARSGSAAIWRVASEPVESWHADVHEDHVGPQLSGQVHGAGPVRCLTDHLDVVASVEQRRETGADQALVIGEQNADHGEDLTGRRALTRNPPPRRNPADKSPPSAAARSRMPVIPLPVPIAEAPSKGAFPSSSISTCMFASS